MNKPGSLLWISWRIFKSSLSSSWSQGNKITYAVLFSITDESIAELCLLESHTPGVSINSVGCWWVVNESERTVSGPLYWNEERMCPWKFPVRPTAFNIKSNWWSVNITRYQYLLFLPEITPPKAAMDLFLIEDFT